MNKTIWNTGLLLVSLGLSQICLAVDMDMRRPDDSGAGPIVSSEKKAHLDESRMSTTMFENEVPLNEGFEVDEELLAELDLDDLETFDNTFEEGLLDDR